MSIRLATTTAFALLFATPAFADCQQDVSSLDEAVIAAETGAATGTTAPATEHQEQVMSEEEESNETADAGAADTGTVTGSIEPVTEHQREVLRALSNEERKQASTVLGEARDMAAAGDEQGCMDKLAEARTMLGLEE